MNTMLLTSALLLWEIGPNIPMPIEAELCIVKAELCMEQQPFPDPCFDDPMTCTCSEDYETCAQDIPELHEPACRLDYVWCVLEPPNPKSQFFDEWSKSCEEAFKICPTFSF